jgi:hypothetical protein
MPYADRSQWYTPYLDVAALKVLRHDTGQHAK